MQRKLLIISMEFDTTGQLLIIYSAFVKYLRKNGNTVKHCISYLDFRSEVFYNMLFGHDTPLNC
jgi:hypothetical protein